jgi:peptidoglycan/xylan/chitin deacetylase (PgdA/CDA1 family)
MFLASTRQSLPGKRIHSSGSLDILTYHAVTPNSPPLGDWCFLSLRKFAAQMKALQRMGRRVLPLADAVSALQEGRLRGRCVSITFDDGYRNNIATALPILERFGFPATIYLVTGLIGEKRTLWSNRVISAVQETKYDKIEFRGQRYDVGSLQQRRETSLRLQRIVKETNGSDPNSASKEIELACGTTVDPEFDKEHDFSMVDEDTIHRAQRTGLIEFGGHTITHPILSTLSDMELSYEIHGSIARVGDITGSPCRSFAYPNGAPQDFDQRAVDLLSGTSVTHAVTTVQARNMEADDPYRLTRWDVGSEVLLPRFIATISGLHPLSLKKMLRSTAGHSSKLGS